MTVFITGAAGFIGYHVATVLLNQGRSVVGVDNVNDYYDPKLKRARLARLAEHDAFTFFEGDISDPDFIGGIADERPDISRIVNLAAQAGVRFSLIDPYAYIRSNVMGHTVVLEMAKKLPECHHVVYASSSSVYGGNSKLPSSVDDPVEKPLSLYGATKRADELISYAYAHLTRIPMTGLRFFTVYGPWGRPDMALFLFTKAILEDRPIDVYNGGDMMRDFTYIDDIVSGVVAALDHPPADRGPDAPPHRVFNIGNHRPEPLGRMIAVIEESLGRKAKWNPLPMQPGDVRASAADIDATQRELGFQPTTPIEVGIPRFIAWYKDYYAV